MAKISILGKCYVAVGVVTVMIGTFIILSSVFVSSYTVSMPWWTGLMIGIVIVSGGICTVIVGIQI